MSAQVRTRKNTLEKCNAFHGGIVLGILFLATLLCAIFYTREGSIQAQPMAEHQESLVRGPFQKMFYDRIAADSTITGFTHQRAEAFDKTINDWIRKNHEKYRILKRYVAVGDGEHVAIVLEYEERK